MRVRVLFAMATLVALAALAATPGGAYLKLRFEQPVQVGETELPAGEYKIRRVDIGSETPLFSIEPEAGTGILAAARREIRPGGERSSRTEAVLQERNGKMYLTSIRIAGQETAFVIFE